MSLSKKDVGAIGLLVAVVSAVAMLALAGGAAATVDTDTANLTAVGTDELANQTLAVDNGTRSLYVELDNDTYNASTAANVTVFAIDNGTETQVDKVQISAATGSTEMYEYTSLDTANYSSYRVLVEGNSTTIESAALDIGTVAEVSSGGGWLSGSSGSAGIGIVLVLALLFIVKD
ncbi:MULTISPECIES: lactonase family protein [Haloferax]|uniref:PGF-CTERM sorting domain-containing protein n=2 Tax=Haloferax TaxID=2251 RepID=A0A6G1Z6A9_9EURY|nr:MULTISPECIES: lactonase family protein [Haloferax]KAB1185668.1 lactonase family protein [Haloferax sp. CBA1149]MRW81931.1 hypothetical protein [Haloferax marinisediminis]